MRAAADGEPAVDAGQLQAAIDNMQRREMARAKAEFDMVAAANKTRGEAFLARNNAAPGVIVAASSAPAQRLPTHTVMIVTKEPRGPGER